jgi:hypothetical protein
MAFQLEIDKSKSIVKIRILKNTILKYKYQTGWTSLKTLFEYQTYLPG